MIYISWAVKSSYSNIAEVIKSGATLYLLFKPPINYHEPAYQLIINNIYFSFLKY